MSHWAEIDENNKVLRVVVCNDNDPDEGYQWLIDNLGGRWIKTSYNSYGGIHYLPDDQRDENGQRIPSGKPHLRFSFAQKGYFYDEEKDAFIPPKPYNSWILNEDTFLWEAPTPYPTNGGTYKWVEEDLNWQLIESEV